jgi:hypothetical protein
VKSKILLAAFTLCFFSSQASAEPAKIGLVFSGNAFFGTFTVADTGGSNLQIPSAFPSNYGIVFQYTQQLPDVPVNGRVGFEIMLPSSTNYSLRETVLFLLIPMKITLDIIYEINPWETDNILVGAGAGYDAIVGFYPLGYTELHTIFGYSKTIAKNLQLSFEAQPGYGFQSGTAIPIINFQAGLRVLLP